MTGRAPLEFSPILSILAPPQRRLWDELGEVPQSFVLVGGTAIALQLEHRSSIDFDFVADRGFDPDDLLRDLTFLREARVSQKSANTLTCVVERNGPVMVSFFGTPSVSLIEPPHVANDNHVRIASLVDLAGMKAAVVQKRAEAKDYIDLDAIIENTEIDLPTALSAARLLYGAKFNPELTLKSLSYFGDGSLPTLPSKIRDRLAKAVAAVDLTHLPPVVRTSQ
jgi:Nucleotidyl transferase AbiEii toxin, Type IV TA system